MKRAVKFSFWFLGFLFGIAQTRNLLFEAGYNFTIPYADETYNFTGLFSVENPEIRIVPHLGIDYISFRYSEDQALTYYTIDSLQVQKIRTYVRSISFPFFLRLNGLKQRKIGISPFLGFSVVLQTRILQKLYLSDGGSKELFKSYPSAKIFPLSGIYFSKKLSERVNLNLVPYASFQLTSYEAFLYPDLRPPKIINLSRFGIRISADFLLWRISRRNRVGDS